MTSNHEKKQSILLTNAHNDYEKGLNAYAFFKINNRVISEDLVQDTFIKTWAYLRKGGKIELMKAFLYHILNNLIIDQYRKRKTTSLDVLLEKGFEPSTVDNEQMINAIDGKSLALLIPDLPIMYIEVMKMRYLQELSIKEMSDITGKSKNAMSVQSHRGLEKLKILYQSKLK